MGWRETIKLLVVETKKPKRFWMAAWALRNSMCDIIYVRSSYRPHICSRAVNTLKARLCGYSIAVLCSFAFAFKNAGKLSRHMCLCELVCMWFYKWNELTLFLDKIKSRIKLHNILIMNGLWILLKLRPDAGFLHL